MRNVPVLCNPATPIPTVVRPHRLQRLIGALVAGAFVAAAPLALGGSPPTSPEDIGGAADIPWLGRYADSVIISYEERIFDRERFLARPTRANANPADFVEHEGHRVRIVYRLPPRRSTLEVYRNFEQRLRADGFEIIWGCALAECLPVGRDFVLHAFGNRVAGVFDRRDRPYESPRYGLFRRGAGTSLQVVALYVGDHQEGPALAALQAIEARPMEGDRIVTRSR